MKTGIGFMCFEQPGSGIMRIALDGPTSAVSIHKTGIAVIMTSLDQTRPRKVSEVETDKKSCDQRYNSCIACIAPENAPSGTKPRVASDRTMQSTTSTIEACISSS
jgi:hypothetical protein